VTKSSASKGSQCYFFLTTRFRLAGFAGFSTFSSAAILLVPFLDPSAPPRLKLDRSLLVFVLSPLPCVALLFLRECFAPRLPPSLVRGWPLFSCLFAASCTDVPLALPLGWSGRGRHSGRDMPRGWRLRCLICRARGGRGSREEILSPRPNLDGGSGKDRFALCV